MASNLSYSFVKIDNYSYRFIRANTIKTIEDHQQMLCYQNIDIEGELIILGELIVL
jgi:hypothetical protein